MTSTNESSTELHGNSTKRSRTLLSENWCNTNFKMKIVSQVWTISNFSLADNTPIKSSEFSPSGVFSYKWSLQLYPQGKDAECKKFLSLFLVFSGVTNLPHNNVIHPAQNIFGGPLAFAAPHTSAPIRDIPSIRAKVKFYILNRENEPVHERQLIHVFDSTNNNAGFKEFIARDIIMDEANDLLHSDKLVLCCKIFVKESEYVLSHSGNRLFKTCDHHARVCTDLESLLESHDFSDVTLIADEKKFQLHRNILSARSPVFRAMFSNNMKEREQNMIEIKDIDHEVFTELVRYIYTGKAENLQKVAYDLLAASDKFELLELKAVCEDALANDFTVDNISNTLVIADQHKADSLKKKAFEFIVQNSSAFIETPGFKTISESHPYLLREMFATTVMRKN